MRNSYLRWTDGQTDRQTQGQVQVLSCAFAAKNMYGVGLNVDNLWLYNSQI